MGRNRDGLVPGFQSEEHRQKLIEANRPYRLGPGCIQPKCEGTARHGGRCGRLALRGRRFCQYHLRGVEWTLAERLRSARTPEQREQRTAKWVKARLNAIWRRGGVNLWHPGRTIDLAHAEPQFRALAARAGLNPDTMAPALIDVARWKFKRSLDLSDPAYFMDAAMRIAARQRDADKLRMEMINVDPAARPADAQPPEA
jgi:hypothetical protein